MKKGGHRTSISGMISIKCNSISKSTGNQQSSVEKVKTPEKAESTKQAKKIKEAV